MKQATSSPSELTIPHCEPHLCRHLDIPATTREATAALRAADPREPMSTLAIARAVQSTRGCRFPHTNATSNLVAAALANLASRGAVVTARGESEYTARFGRADLPLHIAYDDATWLLTEDLPGVIDRENAITAQLTGLNARCGALGAGRPVTRSGDQLTVTLTAGQLASLLELAERGAAAPRISAPARKDHQ